MSKIGKELNAFRRKYRFYLIILLVLSFSLFLPLHVNNQTSGEKPLSEMLKQENESIQYNFTELGLIFKPFMWSGLGSFQTSINKTFDLSNSGPVTLIIEYSTNGSKPENPGYEICGSFNQLDYSTQITRAMMQDNIEKKSQIAIPLNSSGRIFANSLNITILAKNTLNSELMGTFVLHGSSKLLVGEANILEKTGNYQLNLFPTIFSGNSYLESTRYKSYIQFTVVNETLLSESNFDLIFIYEFQGEISYSIFLLDEDKDAFPIMKTEIDTGKINASSAIVPSYGMNIFTLEFAIRSENLWSEEFNFTFTSCLLVIEPTTSGWGFDNLVIPFFNWPNHPFVGILILSVWILPYTILKYRKWKKLPGEVEINFFEDDNSFNILDPEGLSAGDDFDVEDDFDFEEEF